MEAKMSKSVKRFLASFMVVAIVLCSAPLSGFVGVKLPDWLNFGWLTQTASAAETSGKCGDNLTWTFDDETGKLTISGAGEMYDWTKMQETPWHAFVNNIKNVVINKGVKSIGEYAFYGCDVTNIDISDSIVSIKDYAFYGSRITGSVNLPNSIVSIGYRSFAFCVKLTGINILSNIDYIGKEAFYYCSNLENINISSDSVEICDRAFEKTKYYNDEGNWTNNILYIDNCLIVSKKTYAPISSIKAETKVIASLAFSSQSFVNLQLPEQLSYIGAEAFLGCRGIMNLVIPDSVKTIRTGAFKESDVVNATFGIGIESIESEVLSCNSLKYVEIGKNVSNISTSAFSKCSSLEIFKVNSENCYYSNDIYGILYNKDYTKLYIFPKNNSNNSYIIPNGVLSIEDAAFSSCKNLNTVYLPNSITDMGECTFYDCSNLTRVTLSNNLTIIGNQAFSGCTRLNSITIPNCVTTIGKYAFDGCENMNYFVMPDSVTRIGENAFNNTLYYNDTNYWNNEVLYIGNALICSKKSIIGELIIDSNISVIADGAFDGCKNLTNISINNNIKYIGDSTFSDCEKLTGITIGSNVLSIGKRAFKNCYELINIVIPDSVESIGESAFYNCNSLKSVTIGKGIKSIENSAFSNDCCSLHDIYYSETKGQWNQINFNQYNSALKDAKINYGKCEIIFDFNDELGTENSKIIINNTNVGALPIPNRTGYSFAGWYSGDTKVTASTVVSNDVTYTAHWAINAYTVTFDPNGGLVTTTSRKIEYGKQIGELPIPSKEEYLFVGWYSGDKKVTASTVVSNDVTYTAHWAISAYTVTFDPNGGLVTTTSRKIEYGKQIGELPIPSKEGYLFDGWYLDDTKVTESTVVSNDVTYTAHWKKNMCNVTFYADGGYVSTTSKNVEYGKSVGTLPIPSKIGYSFVGWYSGNFKVTVSTVVYNDVTYIARWKTCSVKSVSITDISMNYKNTTKLLENITVDSGAEYIVLYSSSDNSVATVDENGNVYGAKKGSATITCFVTDSNGNTVTDTCNVKVNYSFGQWLIKIFLFGWIWY